MIHGVTIEILILIYFVHWDFKINYVKNELFFTIQAGLLLKLHNWKALASAPKDMERY